ncbi:MAG: transmembrane 220 family protein [Saprospiraceae bacterium]|nr:transmembrane 220 family protein [Saprospiraceae bacterium]
MKFKIINLALAAIFILVAAVQYNDPDPIHWMVLYFFVAGVCGFAAYGHYRQYVLWAGIAVCIIWMGTLLPQMVEWVKMGTPNIAGEMKATTPYIEFAREFFGVGICLAVLLWQLWRMQRRAG